MTHGRKPAPGAAHATEHTFCRTRRVLFGEDDGTGLIFMPYYGHYMVEGLQEFFAAIGHPLWRQGNDGIASPAVSSACDYRAAAHAGDLLNQSVTIRLAAQHSFESLHRFVNQTGTEVATGRTTHCWVHLETMAPVDNPPWLRESLHAPPAVPSLHQPTSGHA